MTPTHPHRGHDARIGQPTASAFCDTKQRRACPGTAAILAAGCVLAASFAHAQDAVAVNSTTIRLRPTERPGAVAEVIVRNVADNDADAAGIILTLGGMSVGVDFDWQHNPAGDDAIRVTPPEGIACLPVDCVLIVPEGDDGTLWLFSADGVGM